MNIKKTITRTVEETVEVSLEDVAKEIADDCSISEFAESIKDNNIDNYILDCIADYSSFNDTEISDSEKEILKNLVISKVTPTIETLKKKELETVSNREKILELLERLLYESDAYEDYNILSTSEILDEIIKNGNK